MNDPAGGVREDRPVTPPEGADEEPALHTEDETDPAFEALLEWLRETRGFDFTGYKRPSLVRRVARRMHDVGIERFEDYQVHLEMHPEEFAGLFNTVLINVTGFFRDREAWTLLEQDLLPPVLARGRPVRAWSAGCSAGQEPYSLAIALAERMGVEEFRRRVKIYATDVDEEALATARAGSYTQSELAGLTDQQVQRWFARDGERFIVSKDLRRAVIFGRNDLVQDAPISHIDILTCRNTLMYLNAETQARVVGRLHFALEPHGVLFLGKAEMLLAHTSLFTPVDLGRRLFRRRTDPLLPARGRVAGGDAEPVEDDERLRRLRQQAMSVSPAAQVVVDAEGRLVQSNHRADRLFGIDAGDIGRPFQDVEVSYRPLELRSHLERATTDRRVQWVRGVELPQPTGEVLLLDVQVVPLTDVDGSPLGATVVFDDVTATRQLREELEYANRQLEAAYEELQSTNEELETTNEELQSTVEELETTNEELQSTNEELETMNEELQSMNDQLHSGNDELRGQTERAVRRHDFVSAVLGGMRAGVAVLDEQLRVVSWNPAAEDLWGVREAEVVGQPMADLDIGLPVVELGPLLRRTAVAQAEHATAQLAAVNRRGRPTQVRVTVSLVHHADGLGHGTVVVMDQVEG